MHRRSLLSLVLLAVALPLTCILLWQLLVPSPTDLAPSSPIPSSPGQAAVSKASSPPHPVVAPYQKPATHLRPPSSSTDLREWLQTLEAELSRSSPAEATGLLLELLHSGQDIPTGLDFTLKPGGNLKTAPTLRTWLLDELADLNPSVAAIEAGKILENPVAADEWAVALRAYAIGTADPNAEAYLQAKARQMIHHQPWLDAPSNGFLEAFDLFVFTKDAEAISDLSALLRLTEDRGLSHAAFLTMDRLMIVAPAATLRQLVELPELMTGREPTRGNFVARADISDAGQRELVESYLLDESRTPRELQSFFGTFPNANFMISNNLLTTNATLPGSELRRRDLEAARVVEQWTVDPRFERLQPLLQPMKRRLDEFVRQHRAANL